MSHEEAMSLIREGILPGSGVWADIGAGTGVFTMALRDLLAQGTVLAFDKNPHMLWRLESTPEVAIKVVEGDFTAAFELPEQADGVLMANALHYAKDHLQALQNVLGNLKPGGTFILIEYDTDRPSPPYVPYPISEQRFGELAPQAGILDWEVIGRKSSIYQGEMYVIRGKV